MTEPNVNDYKTAIFPESAHTTAPGAKLAIWIIGSFSTYIAEVLTEEPLTVKVTEDGPYAKLKGHEIMIWPWESHVLQSDKQPHIDRLLEIAAHRGRPYLSGLKSLGVQDSRLHEILPLSAGGIS